MNMKTRLQKAGAGKVCDSRPQVMSHLCYVVNGKYFRFVSERGPHSI